MNELTELELVELLEGYTATALWAEEDGAPGWSSLGLSAETAATLAADVRAFADAAEALVRQAEGVWGDSLWRRAGHDLWLTRNGHGAGFWDGDWPEALGEQLTEIAHGLGERHLYRGDDGLLYLHEG